HYQENCKDNLDFWQADKIITTLFFVPGVAAAQALTTLNKLGCWLAKQTNATSAALSALLTDTDSVRHEKLQNRATIDFLLLAQGHECDELDEHFAGVKMCCMNLNDHSQLIHQHLSKLKELTDKLTSMWGLESWLQSLGIGGWLGEFIRGALVVLILVIVILL
ncbi:SYNA protein, partial [Asarcornis scutulata]|nr:SYNA protein [Asarcornis scutulata]